MSRSGDELARERAAVRQEEDLQAGRVGRAHGLDGSFYVTGARLPLLECDASVSVAGRSATIVRRAGTERRPIVRLEGIADRAAAEALRGTPLIVARAHAPALAEGEWWSQELVACEVRDGERVLGTVARVMALPSCEALEVRPAEGSEPLLVPMVKDAVRSIDTDARTIEINGEFLGLGDGDARGDARRGGGVGRGD